jgi:hypothetical protein
MTNDKLAKVIAITNPEPNKWIGRIAIFELITGSRVQGKILSVGPDWLHTDTGDIRIEHIVHAKWVGEEEASIIRGGPLGGNGYSLSEPGRFPIR